MKTKIRNIVLAATVVFASLSQTLHAQTKVSVARVYVPFAFEYGSQHLSRGVYRIDMNNSIVLTLRGSAGSVMAMTRKDGDRRPAERSRLVFVKYGDQLYLDQVWITGNAGYIAVNRTKEEKRAARELSLNKAVPTQIELALESTPTIAGGN
jgi:hypothetical protein